MKQRGVLFGSLFIGLAFTVFLTLYGRNKKTAVIPESVALTQESMPEHAHEDHEDHASFGKQLFDALGLSSDWEELVAFKGAERRDKAKALLESEMIKDKSCAEAVLIIESLRPQTEAEGEVIFEAGKLLVDSVLSREYPEAGKEFLSEYAQNAFSMAGKALPERLDVKNALATSKVYLSGDVMGGVQLFLEVINQDPENEAALYNLGMLSIQSGQMDKAEKRFEKLVSLQPENESYARILEDIRSGKTP